MTCSRCGTENPPANRFCGACGAALSRICPACGTANTPDFRFCGQCGGTLQDGDVPVADAIAAEGGESAERRRVSVLFADLVGFTTLSADRDAEDVRELLTRYFDVSRKTIARYGGRVEKFIGDAVMALWGAPVAQEDDAERAVRAGLELVAATAALGAEVGVEGLRARVGVLTGEAAVTIGAEGQGMVAGDLVNTASRVQAAAAPGSVLVGEVTKRATDAAIVYEDAGLHELKGKAEPVHLWRASHVVGLRRGALKSVGIEPPFVGRDRDLHLIKQLFHTVADERKAHLVSVIGIGGIGKSRLAWEFEKYIDGLVEDIWWHRGRCLAYGEGVAFWALAEMVRMRAGIAEEEPPASAIEKLRATVEEHVTDPEERRYVQPRLAHLLGLEDRGPGDQENLFAAWRLFFERMAVANPVILLFDDLQWADSALLDFIEYLMEWSKDLPIFVLTVARPELLDRRPTWGAAKRSFTSLFLEPLPNDAMEELLKGPVPGLQEELRRRILERAEGVPFYAVETVRMLMDRGLLVREGETYQMTGPIETLEVPESLHALIAARLDGLAPEERRVLQDASVLGKSFFKQGVAAVSGASEEEISALLDALVHKEVLSIQVDPRSPERGQYGFLQDLVRKVAYETLSKRARREKHLAAARFLEETWTGEEDELAAILASHYLSAAQAVPEASDAREVRRKARQMMVRAAERASSLGASAEAQRYFEHAIELSDEPLVQAELHERAGIEAWSGVRPDEGAAHFERAKVLFEEVGGLHPAARVSGRLAEVMWDRGRLRDGLEQMDRAFRVLSEEEPDADLAWLAAQTGRFLFFGGDVDQAVDRIERALELAEALDLPEVLSHGLNTKSLLLVSRGRRQEALVILRHALTVALENDKPSAALRAYNNLSEFVSYDDDYEAADGHLRDGLALARRVGDRFWERTLTGAVYPRYALGRWDDVMAAIAELPAEELSRSRTAYSQGYVAFGTAVRVHRGEVADARHILDLFSELRDSSDVQERAEYALGRAILLLADGDPEGALASAERAIDGAWVLGTLHPTIKEALALAADAALTLRDHDRVERVRRVISDLPPGKVSPFLRATSARIEARIARREGETVQPLDGFLAAAGIFRSTGNRFWLGVTLLEHAEALTRDGRGAEAEPLVMESADVFRALKAGPWLERAERLGARSADVASVGAQAPQTSPS